MRVLLAGATGYIGQAVLRELVAQGHEVVALVRPGRRLSFVLSDQRSNESRDVLSDAVTVVEAEITSEEDWTAPLPNADVVVSCLASRSGAPADARLVEYEANRRLLAYAERAAVRHFLLLSAICVLIPRLAFQREKLKFEALLAESAVPATIGRATAFFRSLVGQVERVRAGKPFLLFSSGSSRTPAPRRCQPAALVLSLRFLRVLTTHRPRDRQPQVLSPRDQEAARTPKFLTPEVLKVVEHTKKWVKCSKTPS